MSTVGYLVLESGPLFRGVWHGGEERAGEVVFNTSHSGYEEIATDPSYYSQIMVMTASMQGNYGVDSEIWESDRLWIQGFVCLSLQSSPRDGDWKKRLLDAKIPILSEVDTRRLVLHLRESGTPWGALVQADTDDEARRKASELIPQQKRGERDWAFVASCKKAYDLKGEKADGPRVAVIDFGCKSNILRELKKRCREIRVFPSRATAAEIRAYEPEGILLSNGPGDPQDIQVAVETVRDLLGWRFVFGICMGHHVLALALGGRTYKLKFGHRGSNHPVQDRIQSTIYVTSQNHGYAVDEDSLPKTVQLTHTNLNDGTVSGLYWPEQKCMSVQFHPESHPGPHDAENLFDFFMKQTR